MLRLAIAATLLVSAAHAADPNLKAADIVKPETLGAQVKWLEGQAGPAFKVDGDEAIYKIGGCDVVVTVENDTIKAFKVDNTSACAFDLKAFFGSPDMPPLEGLTFGAFEAATAPQRFYADCVFSCGNAYDPSVYAYWDSGRAGNLVSVTLEAMLVTDDAIDASLKWSETMRKAEGDDYVIDGRYNCETKYNDVARELFKGVKVSAIKIGHTGEPAINTCS